MFCAAGIATNAGVAAAQSWFHPQMTTPKAIAIAAATTMSTVRQLQLIPLMSCTSLWCFENEQRTFTNRDLRGERRNLVAQTASAAEAERFVAQGKAQTRRGDALGVAVHRQEGHERADRPRPREGASSVRGPARRRRPRRCSPSRRSRRDPTAARHRVRRRRPSWPAKQKRRLSAARKGFHASRLPTLTLLRSGSGVCGYPHSQRPFRRALPRRIQLCALNSTPTKQTRRGPSPSLGLALDRP